MDAAKVCWAACVKSADYLAISALLRWNLGGLAGIDVLYVVPAA